MNARFQIAVHILTLLHKTQGELLSSEYIAGSLNTNPALVRKEISNLRKEGMIESKEGKGGGYSLGRPANQITLGDIYRAVQPVFALGQSKNHPNPNCPVGRQINARIGELYQEIDNTIVSNLHATTLQSFSDLFE